MSDKTDLSALAREALLVSGDLHYGDRRRLAQGYLDLVAERETVLALCVEAVGAPAACDDPGLVARVARVARAFDEVVRIDLARAYADQKAARKELDDLRQYTARLDAVEVAGAAYLERAYGLIMAMVRALRWEEDRPLDPQDIQGCIQTAQMVRTQRDAMRKAIHEFVNSLDSTGQMHAPLEASLATVQKLIDSTKTFPEE